MFWPQGVIFIRIFRNLSLALAIFVVISGLPHMMGYKATCTSVPHGAHQVEPGSVLNLTCVSEKHALLAWFKGNEIVSKSITSVQLPGSNIRALVILIHNASTADSGEYECRDKSGTGPVACAWRLDVFAPPSIELDYQMHEHLIGVSTFVGCLASGYPPPIFEWLFNGIEVRNVQVINEHRKSSLKFVLAQTTESGTYTCIAKNSRGRDEKNISLVFRNIPKPVVSTAKYIVFKEKSQNISLPCVATDVSNSKTNTKLTWYHNDSQLPRDHHEEHFFSNNTVASKLWIYNASDEDVGIYWCRVKVFEQIEKSSGTQLIRAKEGLPSVSTEKPLVRSPLGERLILLCSVTYPIYDDVKTSWTKNGSDLPHSYTSHYDPKEARGNYVEMFTFSLTIKNFTLEDVGTYVCMAESATGTNWTSIEVQIQSQTVNGPYSSAEPRVSTSSLVIIFLVAALGSIFAIVSAFTIRYLYVRHKKLAARYKYATSSPKYLYEAFLSFSNHDHEWATTYLIPLLDEYSLTYCITRQDFEVGKFMVENIADCIYQSRTVITIMSKNFMASKHCQQELNIALYKSAEQDDGCLVVIRIDDIEKNLLPKALRNRTFLDYADKEERKHWKRRLLKCLFSHTRNSPETHEDIQYCSKSASVKETKEQDLGRAQKTGVQNGGQK